MLTLWLLQLTLLVLLLTLLAFSNLRADFKSENMLKPR